MRRIEQSIDRERERPGMEQRKEWILICSTNYFDMDRVFVQNSQVTWPLLNGVSKGDTVYIYQTHPQRAIRYRCVVTELPLYHMDRPSEECVKHRLFYGGSQIFMRLDLVETYPETTVGYHGTVTVNFTLQKGTVQQ